MYFTYSNGLKRKTVVSSLSQYKPADVLVDVFLAIQKAWVACRVRAECHNAFRLFMCCLSFFPTGYSFDLLPFPDCLVTSEKSLEAYLHRAVVHDREKPELIAAKLSEGSMAVPMAMSLATSPCCEGVLASGSKVQLC